MLCVARRVSGVTHYTETETPRTTRADVVGAHKRAGMCNERPQLSAAYCTQTDTGRDVVSHKSVLCLTQRDVVKPSDLRSA